MNPTAPTMARVYDEKGADPAPRVLVDRLWPRGLSRADAPFATWAKDVAPSPALRTWYGHQEPLFAEFARRYRAELTEPPAREALAALQEQARRRPLVLLTATRDLAHSGAAVLLAVLKEG